MLQGQQQSLSKFK